LNNTRMLILTVGALIGAGAALAQSPHPRTRAEVRAEALAAVRAGEIRVGDTTVFPDPLSSLGSQRSRAEVHAEALAAVKARAGTMTYGDGTLLDHMLSTPSTLPRAQVRAEAIEARRLGLMDHGDHGQPRLPTPAELESVRQAGVRAIGMENVARR
jgi:Domain of unknown function (DUF4148)